MYPPVRQLTSLRHRPSSIVIDREPDADRETVDRPAASDAQPQKADADQPQKADADQPQKADADQPRPAGPAAH
jgi:hypothetical protein